MKPEPIILHGRVVRLEPLQPVHAADLYAASQDSTIWRYLRENLSLSIDETERWISNTLEAQELGSELPFAIILRETGHAVGSTRYLNISSVNRGLEIGWTWLNPAVQRTGVNTECKYLLLRHAFETLDAIRVQIKTDSRNEQSQRAIERLGAVKEGILRNHMIMPDSYVRHSVYYSIIASEWPQVKSRLEEKMQP